MEKVYPVGELIYPVSQSMSGKNTVYVPCDERACHQNYGVCRFIMDAIDGKRVGEDSFTDCVRATNSGKCRARSMLQEEMDAGKALYYKERVEVEVVSKPVAMRPMAAIDKSSDSYRRGWDKVASGSGTTVRPVKPKPAPIKRTEEVAPPTSDLSRLVSDIAREESVPDSKLQSRV